MTVAFSNAGSCPLAGRYRLQPDPIDNGSYLPLFGYVLKQRGLPFHEKSQGILQLHGCQGSFSFLPEGQGSFYKLILDFFVRSKQVSSSLV